MNQEFIIKGKSVFINFYTRVSLGKDELKVLMLYLENFVRVAPNYAPKGLKEINLSLNLVGDTKMRSLNRTYRGKDKSTDVLSFPLQENIRKGVYDSFLEKLELGDLFISKPVCEKQAREFNLTFGEEFIHLVVHGFLHLLGYDHEISSKEEKIMESLEEEILLKLKRSKNKIFNKTKVN